MNLIDEIDTLWKRWSVWITATQAVLAAMWLALPAEWQPAIPEWGRWAIVILLAAATITAQSVKQKPRDV